MSQGPRPQSRLTSVARGYSFVAARVRESAAGPRRMRIGRLGSVSVMAIFQQLPPFPCENTRVNEDSYLMRWTRISWGTYSPPTDRKSTRLNSSHLGISYAVFCLK